MADNRFSLSKLPREIPFWILFFITIGFFYRPLFHHETFFFRDLYNHFYPQKRLFSELVLSGQLPLWDPYRHGGQPFLANMNNSVLYPSNLLYLVLPVISAFNIDIVFHVLLTAWCAYAFARALGLNQIPATVSSLIYSFSGPALSVPNVWLYATFHLPLILMLWHLYYLENKNRWFVLAALVGTIQVFAGRPEMTAITLGILLLWTIVFPYRVNFFRRLLSLFLLTAAILATAAIQLIPMAELLQQSSRSQGIDAKTFFAWSVNPKRYPELFLPGFLGSVYSVLENDQWGYKFEDLGVPYILSLYFGIPTLVLTIFGALNRKQDEILSRRIRILLIVLVLISVIAIAGRFLPYAGALINSMPAITVFRYPVKFIYLAILPISILAGFELQHLMQISERRNLRTTLFAASFLAGLLAILSVLLLTLPSQASTILGNYFSSDGKAALHGIRSSVLHSAAVSILVALCLSLTYKRNQPKLNAGLGLVIGLDLLIAGISVNHFAPRELLTNTPELASYLKKEIGDRKLYRTGDSASVKFRVPGRDVVYADRWRLEMLSDYTASMYGIPVVFHEDYDRLETQRLELLSQKLRQLPMRERLPILSSAGVGFVLTSEFIRDPDLQLVRIVENSSNTTYFLYRNEKCTRRVFFVGSSTVEQDSGKILDKMSGSNFDPCRMVFLEEFTTGVGVNIANASITISKTKSDFSAHEVITDKPGFLVFSEPYSPGWKWTVDGWTVHPVRGNFAFSAVAIPAGKHKVERVYRPVSFFIGCVVSLMSLLGLALISFIKQRTKTPDEIAASV